VRFVHTSDWHLGKKLCEASLLEDQAYALDQVVDVCAAERADALIVAGDVFDRAVPPVEAVVLLDTFLRRVTTELSIPVILISGNHDSGDRLGFGSDLLEKGKVHLRTRVERRAEPVIVDAGRRRGVLHVYCLPYLEAGDHDAAVREALPAMREDRTERRADEAVLVAHLLAKGGRESLGSERQLVIGGVAAVGTDALAGWSYVALGHLHAPQAVGGRHDVRYSGSPLKYSFGEADQGKSVALVDLVCGRAAVREIPLTPRRDLVRLEATFDELLRAERFAVAESCYVEATYTDAGYVVDAPNRLRERFPWLLMALPKQVLRTIEEGAGPRAAPADARSLVAGFWSYVEGEEPDADLVAAFERALDDVRKGHGTGGGVTCALAS
jgi:exonuclease SbcD